MQYLLVKRILDCVGAVLGMLVLSPVLLIVAILVLCFHGAPVIFEQERITKDARVFRLLKFRSMRPEDPSRGWVTDEDRLTRFGRCLRASSLDELPSLWNVLVGDLSLIGPRPLMPDLLPLYTTRQRRRHSLRCGLSGLAQVSGRNSLSWDDKFDLDVEYVEQVSFRLDLRILLRTIGTVFGRQGVTKEGEATTDSYGGTLRSALVSFEQISRHRKNIRWYVHSLDSRRLGACEMVEVDERTLKIGFDQDPSVAESVSEDVHREVLRLLINRARGADAEYAVCLVMPDSHDHRLLVEAGFLPFTSGPPDFPIERGRGRVSLYCALWPKPIITSDLRLAS